MRKIMLVLMSALMLTGLCSAKENHLEGADTGMLVKLVGQVIPIEKIDVINPTCVVGMTNIVEAGGIPALCYSYWTDDYGIWQNSLGGRFHETEAIFIIIMFDKGLEDGVRAFKNWIMDNAPKDDQLIEKQARDFMKRYNKNDKDYTMFRYEEKKVELSTSISIIYCTKDLARKRGIPVE